MSDEIQQHLKVVRGNPSAEELAALIAIVDATLAEEQALGKKQQRAPKSTWNRNLLQMRGGITPGFVQWSASFRDGLS